MKRYLFYGLQMNVWRSNPCADPEGAGGLNPPLKNYKAIWCLLNTDTDTMENHKAKKSAFNVGPQLAHQQNVIEMVFCWWADDSPL